MGALCIGEWKNLIDLDKETWIKPLSKPVQSHFPRVEKKEPGMIHSSRYDASIFIKISPGKKHRPIIAKYM